MRTKIINLIIFGSLTVSTYVYAQDARDLIRKNACLGCHAQDRKIVGPSFDSIVQRYGSFNSGLVDKIMSGGTGAWGPVPMPANRSISYSDAESIMRFIFAGGLNQPPQTTQALPARVAEVPQGGSISMDLAKQKCGELGFKHGMDTAQAKALRKKIFNELNQAFLKITNRLI